MGVPQVQTIEKIVQAPAPVVMSAPTVVETMRAPMVETIAPTVYGGGVIGAPMVETFAPGMTTMAAPMTTMAAPVTTMAAPMTTVGAPVVGTSYGIPQAFY